MSGGRVAHDERGVLEQAEIVLRQCLDDDDALSAIQVLVANGFAISRTEPSRVAHDQGTEPFPVDGAFSECGTIWLPKSGYTRGQARTWFSGESGVDWLEVSVTSRWMIFAPEHPENYEGFRTYWIECSRETAGAIPVWRCE